MLVVVCFAMSGCVAGYSSSVAFGFGEHGDNAAADIMNGSSSDENSSNRKEEKSDLTSEKNFNNVRHASSPRDGY